MSAKSIDVTLLLLISYTSLPAQESQSAPPAQPSSSVYNRMRRIPATAAQQQQPQQARQAGQFPNPGQFPPEQHAASVPGEQRGQAPVPVSSQNSTPPGQGQTPSGQLGQQPPEPVAQTPTGPALQPPSPPRVSYTSGQLTVIANNSALSDIMNAIEHATGVRVEGTRPDAERVFGQFGPDSPRDVLNSLFSGSKYDFILTGSLDNPGGVQTIILSPHGSAAPTSPVAAASQPNPRPADNDDDEAPVYQGPISEAPQPLVNSSEAGPQRGQQEQQTQQQQQQVKTPEQLLQELQRLRQQQQGQQQGQQQPPPPTVPR